MTQQEIEDLHKVLNNMKTFGGGFASKLSDAWRHADRTNSDKLYSVFKNYYDKYHPNNFGS